MGFAALMGGRALGDGGVSGPLIWDGPSEGWTSPRRGMRWWGHHIGHWEEHDSSETTGAHLAGTHASSCPTTPLRLPARSRDPDPGWQGHDLSTEEVGLALPQIVPCCVPGK